MGSKNERFLRASLGVKPKKGGRGVLKESSKVTNVRVLGGAQLAERSSKQDTQQVIFRTKGKVDGFAWSSHWHARLEGNLTKLLFLGLFVKKGRKLIKKARLQIPLRQERAYGKQHGRGWVRNGTASSSNP